MSEKAGSNSLHTGHFYEQMACDYLQAKGLELIEKNFRCRSGEVDIIMRDSSHLVFVEVRYRKSSRYGSAAESVTSGKQQKLQRAASEYLLKNSKLSKLAARFDVVTINGTAPAQQIEWIPHAFEC